MEGTTTYVRVDATSDLRGPEFKEAVQFFGHLLTVIPRSILVVLLSATILETDVHVCTDLLGTEKLCVLHDSLERRSIDFRVFASGSAGNSLKKRAREHLSEREEAQHIWYTGSRTKAEMSLSTRFS